MQICGVIAEVFHDYRRYLTDGAPVRGAEISLATLLGENNIVSRDRTEIGRAHYLSLCVCCRAPFKPKISRIKVMVFSSPSWVAHKAHDG